MRNDDRHTAAILGWLASIGAAGADDIAAACGLSGSVARSRLRQLEREGLARQLRLLQGTPALHLITRRGLRAAGRPELGPIAVSAASFSHQLAVSRIAAALGHEHGTILSERELRALERAEGRPLASAELGYAADGSTALHRPDLVCWRGPRPVAVEIELTVKAPRRLRWIVRGWARSRLVAGVVYFAPPHVARAVAAARRREQAEERVALLPLDGAEHFPEFDLAASGPDRRVPSQATRSVADPNDPMTARRP
jgi:hypothetical protein